MMRLALHLAGLGLVFAGGALVGYSKSLFSDAPGNAYYLAISERRPQTVEVSGVYMQAHNVSFNDSSLGVMGDRPSDPARGAIGCSADGRFYLERIDFYGLERLVTGHMLYVDAVCNRASTRQDE